MKSFKLDNEPKIKAGFKVPDSYFEDFTERLMHKVAEPDVKVVPLYKRAPVWLSAVAAVLIVALGLSLYFRTGSAATQPDASDIEQYIAYNTSISSYDLIEVLDETDIAELEQSIPINDEAIEDYLTTENIYDYE